MFLNYFARRLAAKDRRFAAIHEAGHFVMARWARGRPVRGWFVKAWIEPTGEMPPDRPNELGFVLYKPIWGGGVQFPSHCRPALSHRRHLMIGVAGALAEQAWEQRFEDDTDPYLDLDVVAGKMSIPKTGTDEPGNWSRKRINAAHRVFHLLRNELWPELIRTSRTLIKEGFVETSPPPVRQRGGRRNGPIRGVPRR